MIDPNTYQLFRYQLQHSIQSRLTTNPAQPQIPLAQSPSPFLPNTYQHQQAFFQPQPQSQPNPVFVQTHLAQPLTQPQLRRPSSVKNNYNPSLSHYESLHSPVTDPRIRSQSQNHNSSHNTLNRSNSAKEKRSLLEGSPQPEMTDAFEEDRYLYMCLKNRELLLKKIKQCETLESEIKDLKKDDIDHKNT